MSDGWCRGNRRDFDLGIMWCATLCQTEHGPPAGAGFAVILTAKSTTVGTTASRHSQDGLCSDTFSGSRTPWQDARIENLITNKF